MKVVIAVLFLVAMMIPSFSPLALAEQGSTVTKSAKKKTNQGATQAPPKKPCTPNPDRACL